MFTNHLTSFPPIIILVKQKAMLLLSNIYKSFCCVYRCPLHDIWIHRCPGYLCLFGSASSHHHGNLKGNVTFFQPLLLTKSQHLVFSCTYFIIYLAFLEIYTQLISLLIKIWIGWTGGRGEGGGGGGEVAHFLSLSRRILKDIYTLFFKVRNRKPNFRTLYRGDRVGESFQQNHS